MSDSAKLLDDIEELVGKFLAFPNKHSHNRTVPSLLDDARRCPSGLNTTLVAGAQTATSAQARDNRLATAPVLPVIRCSSVENE
jgi:hypothetical protein